MSKVRPRVSRSESIVGEKHQFEVMRWVTSNRKDNTDPYGPPVWTTSSDDTPFVIEGSDELPAGNSEVS